MHVVRALVGARDGNNVGDKVVTRDGDSLGLTLGLMLGLAVGAVHPRHVTMQLDRTYADVSHNPISLFATHSDIGRWSTKLASPNASRHDVGDTDGATDGDTLGLVTGDADGDALGLTLGLALGDIDGEGVGAVVGDTDGDAVGLMLGPVVGDAVGLIVGAAHPAHVTLQLALTKSRLHCPSAWYAWHTAYSRLSTKCTTFPEHDSLQLDRMIESLHWSWL